MVGNMIFMLDGWLGPVRSHDSIVVASKWALLLYVWFHIAYIFILVLDIYESCTYNMMLLSVCYIGLDK